jgi:hypothetical protein
LGLRIPKRGSKERGRREATGMGTASKIHHSAVQRAIPRVIAASKSSKPKLKIKVLTPNASSGPSTSIGFFELEPSDIKGRLSLDDICRFIETNQLIHSEFILRIK